MNDQEPAKMNNKDTYYYYSSSSSLSDPCWEEMKDDDKYPCSGNSNSCRPTTTTPDSDRPPFREASEECETKYMELEEKPYENANVEEKRKRKLSSSSFSECDDDDDDDDGIHDITGRMRKQARIAASPEEFENEETTIHKNTNNKNKSKRRQERETSTAWPEICARLRGVEKVDMEEVFRQLWLPPAVIVLGNKESTETDATKQFSLAVVA